MTLFILFGVQCAVAGPPASLWQTGELSFWNSTQTTGELSYNWSAEMVLLRLPSGQIRTFSAGQVQQFTWFDSTQNKRRTFVTLNRNAAGRPQYNFYEVCLTGPLTVVRQLRQQRGWLNRRFSSPVQANDQPGLTSDPDQFRYFVYQDGELLDFDRFYPDIYEPRMSGYDKELYQFSQRHNLNQRSTLGKLVLINHYNFLARQDLQAALAPMPVTTAAP